MNKIFRIDPQSMTGRTFNEFFNKGLFAARIVDWDLTEQSIYIESLLLQIPSNPFWFYDTGKKYIVLDGWNRLATINNFLNNELILNNLETLPELNGKKFSDIVLAHKWVRNKQFVINECYYKLTSEDLINIYKRVSAKQINYFKQYLKNALED